MKKINILQVVPGMNRGGVETFLMNALRNIDSDKFQFVFLCYGNNKFDYEDELILLGAKLVKIPDLKLLNVQKNIRDIQRVMKEEHIDILHAHTFYRHSIPVLIAAKKAGVSVRVVHSHTTQAKFTPSIVKKAQYSISKIILKHYLTDALACSKSAGEAFFAKNSTFRVIRNGINVNQFLGNATIRKNVRRQLDIEDCFVIGHVGRFDDEKNHDFLLDVFSDIYREKNNAVLMLIGEGRNEAAIKEKSKKLDISKNVLFMGVRADVAHLMQAMDAFVLPSKHEGLGIVLIEAQAAGLTCFASKSVIPSEAKITGNLTFIDLKDGSRKWAAAIVAASYKAHPKKDMSKIVRDSGYDMSTEIAHLEHFYERVAK